MAEVTLVADGEGALRCLACNLSGITDAVAHADWHDEYDRRLLDKGHDAGYLQAHTELVAIATAAGKEYTATERKGIGKATQAAWAALQNRWADV